jgi:large subunit ribosomal protein L35
MPKLKTHSSSKKRFSFTGSGRIKRAKAYRRHILTKKTMKTKRQLRKAAIVTSANEDAIRLLMPYK